MKIAAGNAGESAKCSNIAYTAPIRCSRPPYDKNYMDGIEKTPNRAILKGRLSGQPFCVPAFQSCMVTDGNIREQPLSRKGRRLFYTLYLSPRFSRAGKNSNFQF